ncbi:MAG: hypothetical protein ABH844_02170 [Candidatus Omnitrophota bacterium]
MKKIILLEPDKEQAEVFFRWLTEEGYEVKAEDNARSVLSLLSAEKFNSGIIDMDSAEEAVMLYQEVREDLRFSNIPIFTLIYRTRIKDVTALLSAGVEGLLFKPFEIDNFSKRLKALTKETEFAKVGKKLIDQNNINSLINLTAEAGREDFFALAAVIFNKLIISKINTIIGGPIITQIIKRCDELIGEDYAFMKEVSFSNGQILMPGVDKASQNVPVKKLTFAFRDYIYAFLHMVQTLTSDILMEREIE